MQVTTTLLLFIASTPALTSARGLPKAHELLPVEGALFRRATCDTTPSATSTSAQPVATVTASTPLDCQSQCQANARCKSFVFGTDSSGTVECLLYSVFASEIPTQDSSSLKAYDASCTGVPTVASTTSTNSGTSSDQSSSVAGQRRRSRRSSQRN